MKRMKILSLIAAIVLGIFSQQEVSAQAVSRSAVLFLRIPQGARAIAMGRSYVAIADDASATFWNPAGLGSSRLADHQESIEVPVQFRPITEVVSRQENQGKSGENFELWAVGNNRLVRFRDGKWIDREVIVTKTSDQFDQIIAKYISADNPAVREAMYRRVTAANNRQSYEMVTNLRDSIKQSLTPPDSMPQLVAWADSLERLWRDCRLNGSAFDNLTREFASLKADGSIAGGDAKRLSEALVACRNSFVPEEIVVPFSALTGEKIKTISANANMVMVVAETGLLSYVGNGWRVIGGEGTGALSSESDINDIAVAGSSFYVATERGLVVISGSEIDSSPTSKGLPAGAVTFIGGTSSTNMFAVVDNDLFRFDGMVWTNSTPYLVPIDASVEKIARRFAPYGTTADQALYLSKLTKQTVVAPADSAAAGTVSNASGQLALVPGSVVEIPYLSKLRGKVTDVIEAYGSLFVATEYGLLKRTDDGWRLMGYDSVAFSQPLDSVALLAAGISGESLDGYRERIMAVNDLTVESIPDGHQIWIPNRAAAGPCSQIQRVEGKLLFTTRSGVYQYDGVTFTRASLDGINMGDLVTAIPAGRDIWYASQDEAVTTIPGSSDLTLSYVKWLPNLASDLYFLPLSGAFNLGSAGTIGVNLTGISYGVIQRTNEAGLAIGEFNSYDAALTVSYGRAITNRFKGGLSFKVIQSRLSEQGAGQEKGSGDAFGWAFDFGGLYQPSDRFSIGAAVSNIGPKMSYIDAAQSDPLPANLGLGVASYLMKSAKSHFLLTLEGDFQLIGLNTKDMLTESTRKGGLEFLYEDLFAIRGGFYNDQLGRVSFLTVGVGFRPIQQIGLDIAYVIDNEDQPLSGTFPISLNVRL